MEIIRAPHELQEKMRIRRQQGQIIGLVPTMGALHAGHLALLRAARPACGVLLTSIFVNPIQFNNPSDLDSYPRTWENDIAACEAKGVDVVYAPTVEAMYPPGFQTKVRTGKMASGLCGASRPGHFDGMATVVLKLFNASLAHYAWFGEKDFQQLKILQQMVNDFDLDIKLIPVPIVREASGLALSSRNLRLSEEEKKQALILSRTLREIAAAAAAGEREVTKLLDMGRRAIAAETLALDYLEIVSSETLEPLTRLRGPARALLAVWVGAVRLIDNIDISFAD
jgi:pantoate--beta-alanine ligase